MSLKVSILLPTFNGEEYLQDLLTSLKNQTHDTFELIVKDDYSMDSTRDLLQQEKISFFNSSFNIGSKESFNFLLQKALESESDYFMFCDQDDVWDKHKITLSVQKIQELEKLYPNSPVAVHSDLAVVDSTLKTINNSFWNHEKIDPHKNSLRELLVQNTITGCTLIINKELAKLVTPIPKEAIMHDWWIALVTTTFGHIHSIEKPLVQYRQHQKNVIGATNYSLKNLLKKLSAIDSAKYLLQASKFLEIYQNKLSHKDRELLEAFVNIKDKNRAEKIFVLLKNKIAKQGFLKNLALLFSI